MVKFLRTAVIKKAELLIPTIFFITVYILVFNAPLNLLAQPGRLGYWFTLALFEYYIIYALYRIFCNVFNRKEGMDWLLIAGSFILYFIVTQSFLRRVNINDTISDLLGLNQLKYFFYFAVGIIIRKHFQKVQTYMLNTKILTFCILAFFAVFIWSEKVGNFNNALIYHLCSFTEGLLGILTVFLFFYTYKTIFENSTKIGSLLQYIGKHTLCIYVLHYFFIPRNLQCIGSFFVSNPNPVIESVITIILTMIVTAVTLIAEKVLSMSPFLSRWLFLKKY